MRGHFKAAQTISLCIIATLFICVIQGGTAGAAPVTTLSISEPKFGTDTVYVNLETLFTLTAVDSLLAPVSDIWYHWDSYNYTKYTGPFNAAVEMPSTGGPPPLPIDLEEGTHILYYNSTDSTGQTEPAKTMAVHVDNSPPITQVIFDGAHFSGDCEYLESGTQLSLVSSETGAGVAEIRYSFGGRPETVFTTPLTFSGNGLQTVLYHSVDNLGNREPDRTVIVSVDDDAPEVHIALGTPQCTSGSSTFVAESTPISLDIVEISGVASSSCRIDSGAWTAYTGPFTLASEGEHTIAARATDNLGHASSEISLTLKVDSTAPAVTVGGLENGEVSLVYGNPLYLNCTDSGAGNCVVYYRLGGDPHWNVYSNPPIIYNTTSVQYYAVDELGNTAETGTVQILVTGGTVPPTGWVSWKLYLGIALIAGGVAIAALTFMYTRGSQEEPPEKPERKTVRERPENRPAKKKKLRKRNY